MAIWQGKYECEQCGQGDENLVDTARPEVLREMGRSALLKCCICGHEFMVKTGLAKFLRDLGGMEA